MAVNLAGLRLSRTAMRMHLGAFFAEIFVRSDAETIRPGHPLIYVVNHVSRWDAEVLIYASVCRARRPVIIADDSVLQAVPFGQSLGLRRIRGDILPTAAVREFRRELPEASASCVWVMPQRSHWPVEKTSHLDHGPALLAREFGWESIRYASLTYEHVGGRRPFVYLIEETTSPVALRGQTSSLGSRAFWLDRFHESHAMHERALSADQYPIAGLLHGPRYGLTRGVPTSVGAVARCLRNTSARPTVLDGHITIDPGRESLTQLQDTLKVLGVDRAKSMLADLVGETQ